MRNDQLRYPKGHQPWDPINGLRVGVLVGALGGAGIAALVGSLPGLLIVGGATVGAVIGYFDQRRRLRR